MSFEIATSDEQDLVGGFAGTEAASYDIDRDPEYLQAVLARDQDGMRGYLYPRSEAGSASPDADVDDLVGSIEDILDRVPVHYVSERTEELERV